MRSELIKEIRSEAHAYQLTRRLLKQLRRSSSKDGTVEFEDYIMDILLKIKPGNYYYITPEDVITFSKSRRFFVIQRRQ